jgi:hypothetical protein
VCGSELTLTVGAVGSDGAARPRKRLFVNGMLARGTSKLRPTHCVYGVE